jgi:hypothetical protein
MGKNLQRSIRDRYSDAMIGQTQAERNPALVIGLKSRLARFSHPEGPPDRSGDNRPTSEEE